MNYIIIIGMIVLSLFFTILSFRVRDESQLMFLTATGFLFLVTGMMILMYGIEVPIGTLTSIVR